MIMIEFEDIYEKTEGESNFGKSTLITWQDAGKVVDDWFEKYLRDMTAAATATCILNPFRAWQFNRVATRIILKHWALAHIDLFAQLYTQSRPRRGLQKVTTRKPWVPTAIRGGVEFGYHCGKPAWKRPPGRPPLSRSAWIERETARINARRAKSKTGRANKNRQPLPTEPPDTQVPRPKRGEDFGKEIQRSIGKKIIQGAERFAKRLFHEKEKLLEELAKEGGKKFAEFATHEGKDKALEFWNQFVFSPAKQFAPDKSEIRFDFNFSLP